MLMVVVMVMIMVMIMIAVLSMRVIMAAPRSVHMALGGVFLAQEPVGFVRHVGITVGIELIHAREYVKPHGL